MAFVVDFRYTNSNGSGTKARGIAIGGAEKSAKLYAISEIEGFVESDELGFPEGKHMVTLVEAACRIHRQGTNYTENTTSTSATQVRTSPLSNMDGD